MLIIHIFVVISIISFLLGCLFSSGGVLQVFRIAYITALLSSTGFLLAPQTIFVLLTLIFGAIATGFLVSFQFIAGQTSNNEDDSRLVDDLINVLVFSKIAEIGRSNYTNFKSLSQQGKIQYIKSLQEAESILKRFCLDFEDSPEFQKLFYQTEKEISFFDNLAMQKPKRVPVRNRPIAGPAAAAR